MLKKLLKNSSPIHCDECLFTDACPGRSAFQDSCTPCPANMTAEEYEREYYSQIKEATKFEKDQD